MDALDANASPMLQLARIADKQISEAALRAFWVVLALVVNVWIRRVKAFQVVNVLVWLWP